MSTPSELSFDEILKYMLEHNGKVTNYELVKHFKVFLMNPDMRDEARNTFKKHVNSLAIIKNQNNEKWLILKKKYMPNNGKENDDIVENKVESSLGNINEASSEVEQTPDPEPPAPPRPPLPLQLNQDFSLLQNLIQDSTPSVSVQNIAESESKECLLSLQNDDIPPKVRPRKRSEKNEKQSSIPGQEQSTSIPDQDLADLNETILPTLSASRSETILVDNEQMISVKERKQMFNRMASESDVLKTNKLGNNFNTQGVDEEDRISLDQKSETDPLDSKQKQWILCAARGEYHALAKMCKENSKLVKTKDPFTTAMHWACKRGDENLVKLLGGMARHVVNERSGYTPLHIAMQFRHENVYRLLVEVYDADPNVRDWSGRKPRQYLVHVDTSLSPGSYRSKARLSGKELFIDKARKGISGSSDDLRRTVSSAAAIRVATNTLNRHPSKKDKRLSLHEKEGFLRIGSLNVRVKKTTEAFSNFLGVGATRSSAYVPKTNRDREDRRSEDGDLHKSWGSADNIQKDDKLMPPPVNNTKVRRRGAGGRRGVGASHSRSTPSTPDQPRAQIGVSEEADSDSDTAAGFHSNWRQQRASHCT